MALSTLKVQGRETQEIGAVEPSEARLRALLLGILVVIGPPLLFFSYFKLMFPGLTNPDALDFAQLGRNIGSGHGFVTHILRPLALNPAYGSNPLRQPDVTHGPLYPFFLAIAFGALGAHDSVVGLVSGLFYLLTLPVLYQLGTRMFGQRIGLVTTLIYMFNGLILQYAASGLHFTLAIFLTTCLFLAIYQIAEREQIYVDHPEANPPRGPLLWAGALAGLLYLTDPVFFWVTPATLAAVVGICRSRRLPSIVWCAIPWMVLALPWMVRLGSLTGNPIFGLRGTEIVMGTPLYPGYYAYRLTGSQVALGVDLFQAVAKKILLAAGQVIQAFPQVTASWVLAFFLPCLFFRYRNPAVGSVRRAVIYCFVAIFAGAVLFPLQLQLLVAPIPGILIFSVAYLLHLVGQAKMSRNGVMAVTALVAVAVVYPLLSDVALVGRAHALNEVAPARALGKVMQRDDIVLSDEPWIAAWYSDSPSLWLPARDESLPGFEQQFKGKIRGLLLTDQTPKMSSNWGDIYQMFIQQVNTPYSLYEKTPPEKRPANPPAGIVINSRAASEKLPASFKVIVNALDGFASIPPSGEAASLATVVAAVPSSNPRGRSRQ